MTGPRYLPCPVSDQAQWIVDGLVPYGESIALLLPPVFESYVRVLHPFLDADDAPVTAGALAERLDAELRPFGRTVPDQPGIDYVIAGYDDHDLRSMNIESPQPGRLPSSVIALLVPVLGTRTATPESCYFAVWDGYGSFGPGTGATFATHARTWSLYGGPIEAVYGHFDDDALVPDIGPNFWWPAGREWCVATEVDFGCSYVGCTRATAAALVASELEAFEVPATARPAA